MNNADEKSQEDLVNIRNDSKVGSEEYQRAKDNIEDIRSDTNNNQVGDLANVFKTYKNETNRTIRDNRRLTIVAVSIASIALIIQIAEFFLKYSIFGY